MIQSRVNVHTPRQKHSVNGRKEVGGTNTAVIHYDQSSEIEITSKKAVIAVIK